MRHAVLTLVAAAGVSLPATAPAQAAPRLPDNLAWVVSGGTWRSDTLRGSYRLFGTCDGWDHIICRVYIQWLVEDEAQMRVRLVGTRLISEVSGAYALAAPELILSDSATSVRIHGVEPHVMVDSTWTIQLGPPRQYRVVQRGGRALPRR